MHCDNERRGNVNIEQALAGLNPKDIEDMDWRNPVFRWKS